MPDSQLPTEGSRPYDGWDLEGLLSGDNVQLPEGMRPVAAALDALRAAPAAAELAGEADARAMFARLMAASESTPAFTGPVSSAVSVDQVFEPVEAHTLITPASAPRPTTALEARPRPRHAHRRPPRPGRWRPRALAGVAAAAVLIVGGVVLSGALSGGGGQPGRAGQNLGAPGASPSSVSTSRGSGGLVEAGGATKEATATATPSASGGHQSSTGSGALGPSELCRQYWAFFTHPESSADWAAERRNLDRLTNLAGGWWNVAAFCAPYNQWGAGSQGQDQGQQAANTNGSGTNGNSNQQ